MSNITKIKKIAKAINMLCTNNSVDVTVGGTTAFSTGGRINIPFGDFSNPRFLRMAHGYIDHETGHEAETIHSTMLTMKNQYKNLGGSILNALEDARMEALQGKRFPGARINLETLWELAIEEDLIEHPAKMDNVMSVVFSYILSYSRYVVCGYVNTHSVPARSMIIQSLGQEFELELTALIEKTKKAKTSHCALKIACDICELLKMKQEEQQQQNSSDDSDGSEESEESSDNSDSSNSPSSDDSETDSDDTEKADEASDGNSAEDDSDDDSEGSDDANSTDEESNDDSEGASGSDSTVDDTEDTDASEGTDDDSENGSGGSDTTVDNTEETEVSEGTDDDSEGAAGDDETNGNVGGDLAGGMAEMEDGDGEDYHEEIAKLLSDMAQELEGEDDEFAEYEVDLCSQTFEYGPEVEDWRRLSSKFARTLQRVIIDHSESIKMGSNTGRKLLDRSIALIPAGKENVFEYKEEEEAPTSSVLLLVDASGSMNGPKMIEANKTALAFAKAFQRMSIDTEVDYFGVYDQRRNKNTIYQAKRFGERIKLDNFRVKASGSTPTHDAVFFGLTRLVNSQSDNKIIIVITDGQPDDQRIVKNIAGIAMKAGVKIVPIGLGTQSVHGFEESVFARNSEEVNQALKQAIKKKLF